MLNLAVFFGGVSVEHEISIITGVLTLNAAKAKFNAFAVYIAPCGNWYTGECLKEIEFYKELDIKRLKKVVLIPNCDTLYIKKNKRLIAFKKIDCAINCCHGSLGENGALSGILDFCNISSASPDILASSAAYDKSVCKLIAKASGIKTVPALKVAKLDFEKRAAAAEKYLTEKIGFPIIVKPNSLGSSIGITTVYDVESLRRALDLAFLYDTCALCEKLIADKKEINCAAYEKQGEVIVSECDQPELSGDFLTFSEKYLEDNKDRKAPFADIDFKTKQKIKSMTKQIYKRLNLKGIVRADFLYDGEDVYFNELNAIPGSLAFYLFLDSAENLASLIEVLVREGICHKAEKDKLTQVFYSGVISKFAGKGSKRLKKI